ncbi:MAG: DNA-binding protein [Acidobacteria bacterium]|nr:MAG: DNA-binding protein [Acidobacteriota bacterium]REK04496.1 MAG: DNA-binding protein [Acidobacteriota bacterium]
MIERRNAFLSTKEAAAFLGVSPRTFENWRLTGSGPRYSKVGRLVRYRLADLEDYVERNARLSTSEAS